MPEWLASIFAFLLILLPGGLWMAFWFFAVDWKRLTPVLRGGAWVPVVLLIVVSALVWSRISPSTYECLGLVTLPNFWWQLGSMLALAATALFSGWLQSITGYEPSEVPIEETASEGQTH